MTDTGALFSFRDEEGAIRCGLCPRHCVFRKNGDSGFCGTRRLVDNELIAANYGRLIAARSDPIEKKPLYHYAPGSLSFSIATAGCNLSCPFCQNYSISQDTKHLLKKGRVPGEFIAPEDLVNMARSENCRSISVTYTEPVLLLEYVKDVSPIARKRDIGVVFVTNGAYSPEAAAEVAGLIDAANVDLKCFSTKRYKEVCGVGLSSVLDTIETLVSAGVWVEITTLVVPGFSDDEEELAAAAGHIASVSKDIPWHISRFHPDYKWTDTGATPLDLMKRARETGLEAGLKYVYTGNVMIDPGTDTYCTGCGQKLISRHGFSARVEGIQNGKCTNCGTAVAGRRLP